MGDQSEPPATSLRVVRQGHAEPLAVEDIRQTSLLLEREARVGLRRKSRSRWTVSMWMRPKRLVGGLKVLVGKGVGR